MKKIYAVLMVTLLVLVSVFAQGSNEKISLAQTDNPPVASIGVVFTTAGLGDNNFNDMVHAGLVKAKEDFGITFDYAEPASDGEIITTLYDFAQSGKYDLLITLSSESSSATEEVSKKYPNQKFCIIDTVVDGSNVHSLSKAGQEQCFLDGVLASLMTQDTSYPLINDKKVVGAVVGADFPTLRALTAGFVAGAKFYDSSVEVVTAIVGSFTDVNKGKELALSLYNKGADMIQNLQGSGTGIFAAAEEAGFYAFGCGANQNGISPDRIVCTSGFVLTQIVYDECKSIIDGTWKSGVSNPGLRNGAFENLYENSNITVSAEILAKVEEAKNWFLQNPDIQLPTEVSDVDAWIAQYRK